MPNYFCVNKSGVTIPVFAYDYQTRIGSIFDRESFGFDAEDGGDWVDDKIIFRNSSGNLEWGYIQGGNYPFSNCTDYPYQTGISIKGGTYYTFFMRNMETVYRADGTYWGKVAAGCRVATDNPYSGDSNPQWKSIKYVESSSGGWVAVNDYAGDHGYVNTGMDTHGSSWNTISMYGSW